MELDLEHIDLAGIEVWWGSEEYSEQRASISYWMGRARGMGRTITATKTSSLGTVPAMYGYNTVTGYADAEGNESVGSTVTAESLEKQGYRVKIV